MRVKTGTRDRVANNLKKVENHRRDCWERKAPGVFDFITAFHRSIFVHTFCIRPAKRMFTYVLFSARLMRQYAPSDGAILIIPLKV